MKDLVTKIQLEHEITIKQMKEQHLTTLNELKKTHNKELEHAESKIDSCVQSTRVKKKKEKRKKEKRTRLYSSFITILLG